MWDSNSQPFKMAQASSLRLWPGEALVLAFPNLLKNCKKIRNDTGKSIFWGKVVFPQLVWSWFVCFWNVGNKKTLVAFWTGVTKFDRDSVTEALRLGEYLDGRLLENFGYGWHGFESLHEVKCTTFFWASLEIIVHYSAFCSWAGHLGFTTTCGGSVMTSL